MISLDDLIPKDAERLAKQTQKTDTCWLWLGCKSKSGYGKFQLRKKTARTHRVAYMLAYGAIPTDKYVLHRCDVRLCVRPDHLWLGDHEDNMRDMAAKGRAATAANAKHGLIVHPEARAKGLRNGAYTHPEMRRIGDANGARTKPERRCRGDKHWARQHPERVLRGDDHWTRKHPDIVAAMAAKRRELGNVRGAAKLTEAQVLEIRAQAASGKRYTALAREYGVSNVCISAVVRRLTWTHI